MARLVYLQDVCPDSWQLWTVSGEGSCLRDYRFSPTKEERELSTSDIETMLTKPEHFWEMAPHISYKDTEFWREQISLKNASMSLAPIDDVTEGDGGHRLQSLFASRVKSLLTTGESNELTQFVVEWIEGFSHVVEREQFNHWDNTDATQHRNIEDGFSWTASLLEYCRSTPQLDFIATGEPDTDFGLFAAEVCLGLSSKSNPFQDGRQNSIQPDGLGVRRDNSLVVFEMKGPQDDHDPFTAMLQALCGALAATAKRSWVVSTAESECGRRPSILLAGKNDEGFRVHLYVAIVAKHGEVIAVKGDARIEEAIPKLKTAFPQLGDVVFFLPQYSQFDKGKHFPADVVYR
ncbi:hypothetical protein [Thalassoroseus pseudoceratinae]|uniref:hypothetical protein n=1 Tax=Thalassoroseus pseudoceratinae TaxID=2713176 RepID=UPI00141E0D8E|nr:hypothetical protein [Thalassoroseus pseudoceratinae]